MQKAVGAIEPAERGNLPEALCRRQRAMDRIEIIRDRQNSATADETVDLNPKRDECDEVNRAEESQENRAGVLIGCRLGGFPDEQHIELVKAVSMIGDEPVEPLGQERESGKKIVKPEEPAVMPDEPEHAEDRA